MAGLWALEIKNISSVRVVDFDVNRGLDPNSPDFTSTFRAGLQLTRVESTFNASISFFPINHSSIQHAAAHQD